MVIYSKKRDLCSTIIFLWIEDKKYYVYQKIVSHLKNEYFSYSDNIRQSRHHQNMTDEKTQKIEIIIKVENIMNERNYVVRIF